MTNSYYNNSTPPATRKATLASSTFNGEMGDVEDGFDAMPDIAVLNTDRVSFAIDSGAADVYVAGMHKAATAYATGMMVDLEVSATNTGASTVNVDGLGAKSIKLANGADPRAGDLTAGDVVSLVYDGTDFRINSTVRSIISGTAPLGAPEVKVAYENNANSNPFTDAEQTTLGYITLGSALDLDAVDTSADNMTVTGAIDLDTIGTKFGYISVTSAINLDLAGAVNLTSEGSITAGNTISIDSDGEASHVNEQSNYDAGASTTVSWSFDQLGENGDKTVIRVEKGKAVIVTCNDDDASDSGHAFVVTYDEDDVDGTLTAHAEVEFETGTTEYPKACLISPNKILVVYFDAGDTDKPKVVILRIIGTDVEVGTPVTIDGTITAGADRNFLDVDCIGNDKAIVAFRAAVSGPVASKCGVITVSGLTPTVGTLATIDSNAVAELGITALDDDYAFLTYCDTSDSNYMNASVISVDSTTVTIGTSARVYAQTADYYAWCKMVKKETTGYRVIACGGTYSSGGYAHLITVDGDTFTVDSSTSIGNYSIYFAASDCSEDGTGTLLAENGITDHTTLMYDIDLGADTITYKTSISQLGSSYHGFDFVSDDKFILFQDYSTTQKIQIYEARDSDRSSFIGLAGESVADATEFAVTTAGQVNESVSGLTATEEYYVDWDGSPTTEVTPIYAGIALSATSLLVEGGNP